MADAFDVCAVRMEERQRRAGPEQEAYRDAFGQLGEQGAKRHAGRVADESGVGRDVPAGDVDMRPCLAQVGCDARQSLRTVDQHLERAAAPGRRLTRRPERVPGRLERALPADPPQAPGVMQAHEPLQAPAGGLV